VSTRAARFTLPQPNQETVTVLFDVLGDGRLITSDGSAIHIKKASALASLLWEPSSGVQVSCTPRHSGSPWRWRAGLRVRPKRHKHL